MMSSEYKYFRSRQSIYMLPDRELTIHFIVFLQRGFRGRLRASSAPKARSDKRSGRWLCELHRAKQ
jgi:hypothetical protein